jgi:hypothetical protein
MYTLLVTGDVPGASSYFNPLLQQSIIPCTSGTRPSSPPDGMMIWETDTERYMSWNATLAAWVYVAQMIPGTYTPTLTAVTTNPTLGSGGGQAARFTLFGGKWCTIRGSVVFGTSGTNAGSGQYKIDLPFQAASSITGGVPFVGSGVVRCAGSVATVTWFSSSGSTTMAALTTSGNNVASGAPGAWTANDYLSFTMTYEIA